MDSIAELEKFVCKFKSLVESGSNVRLIVSAEDGVVKFDMSLHLSVQIKDQDQFKAGNIAHRKGGGSPCRQRRRLCREAERKARASADETQAKSTEEVVVFSNVSSISQPEKASEADFEIAVEVQGDVKNYEITEAIEENFCGGLKDEKVSPNDPLQSIYVHKLKVGKHEDSNGDRKYTFYIVTVKNDAKAIGVVESWAKPGGFDD